MGAPNITYPSQDEIMQAGALLEWIDLNFLRADPYAFRDVGFKSIAALVTREFGVDPNGVFCIGSGAVGLSLNPGKIQEGSLKAFDSSSDLDLAFISEVYFEQAWRDLREASQPTVEEISERLQENIRWQRRRFFDGAILTNKLLPDLSFGSKWHSAEVRLEEAISILLDREVPVNYWLYRDYWSVRNYISNSITRCQRSLV